MKRFIFIFVPFLLIQNAFSAHDGIYCSQLINDLQNLPESGVNKFDRCVKVCEELDGPPFRGIQWKDEVQLCQIGTYSYFVHTHTFFHLETARKTVYKL